MNTPAQTRIDYTAAFSRKLKGHDLPRYIAVEGPIGVGKTTLANRLAETFSYPVLLEPAADNPFLDRFYRDGRKHALPTQLFFLLNRARQVSELDADDLLGPTLVADFLMEKDDLFARATLDDNEYSLYRQIVETLAIQPVTPDLVIYLQAPVNVLLQRIHQRGISYERGIDSDYVELLNSAYTEFFHFYNAAPLLVINATEIDFAHNNSHFEALLDQVLSMDGSRQYFNPNPTLL
ncbi:MAG: deoxynucleoside kinase [Gammaproteobacteria bacterium]|nr:deoxynucleoside kinase [Gammaproteobacteria bacterium]MCZ6852427.1 deoxynucleoside kinase [Gammaproteobacteria bacterium]